LIHFYKRYRFRDMSTYQGSQRSIYSTASTTRSTRTLGTHSRGLATKNTKQYWWQRPLVQNAFYTDLTTGAWHIAFYTLFLSIWSGLTAIFEIYVLEEASPGSSHTGYYLFSFDFVYVGNHHVRNLLMMSAVLTLVGSLALFVTSCITLDALRLEKETGFQSWLVTMGLFTPWRIVAWVYACIVNDMIFGYHIVMFFAWLLFNILNVLSWMVMYSLYLELTGISKLEDMAKLKMDTLSSRAGSLYGSRPTSPHSGNTKSSRAGTLQSHGSNASSYGYSGVPPPTQQPRRQEYSTSIY